MSEIIDSIPPNVVAVKADDRVSVGSYLFWIGLFAVAFCLAVVFVNKIIGQKCPSFMDLPDGFFWILSVLGVYIFLAIGLVVVKVVFDDIVV